MSAYTNSYMAFLSFNNIGISSMCSAAPAQVIKNREYQVDFFGQQAVDDITDKIGIEERRFAENSVCASDLCLAAAERLLAEGDIDRSSIDLLVFVSETPDYKFPQTALILQDKLGLDKSTMAFDLPMGCSAVLYGLSVVYGLLQNSGLKRALLLFGETNSRVYSPRDRSSAFIFGDAATAMIVEQGDHFGSSIFSINSDGSKHDYIMVEAGGSRCPSSEATMKEEVLDEHGNMRSLEQAWMKGAEVFQLVLASVPRDIKKLLKHAELEISDLDHVVFHQANDFMISHVAKKLRIPAEKVPSTIRHFGNTGGVSVPFTMTECLSESLSSSEKKRVLLSAFGIGMTWGSCILEMSHCQIYPRVEL